MFTDPTHTLAGRRFWAADALRKTPAPEVRAAGGTHGAGEGGGLRLARRGLPTLRRGEVG